jgi:tRNA dimethylallyltransferase
MKHTLQVKRPIFVICGPTSSGKTGLSLDLCKKYGGIIISADSRQVCKLMDIGTAKIPVSGGFNVKKTKDYWLVDGIKLYGYDLISPDQFFSAYDFTVYALSVIKNADPKENIFVVGGTGFYIDTLTQVVTLSGSEPNAILREDLNDLSLEELQAKLLALDKTVYEKLDQKNRVRLIRAIEKLQTTTTPPHVIDYPTNLEYISLGLTASREYLYKKVDAWAEEVWATGLLEETQNLLKLGYGETARMQGLVYKSAVSYLNQDLTKEQAIERTKFDLHAYIRRQQTWFKRNPKITWFEVSDENYKNLVYNLVESRIKHG